MSNDNSTQNKDEIEVKTTFRLISEPTKSKEKRGRGRPPTSKLDPYFDEIIKRLKLGITPKAIAAQCGTTRATLYNFMEKHEIIMNKLNQEAYKISINHKIVVIEKEMDI